MHRQQHSFLIHEQMFLRKCRHLLDIYTYICTNAKKKKKKKNIKNHGITLTDVFLTDTLRSFWYSIDGKWFGIIISVLSLLLITKWTTLQWNAMNRYENVRRWKTAQCTYFEDGSYCKGLPRYHVCQFVIMRRLALSPVFENIREIDCKGYTFYHRPVIARHYISRIKWSCRHSCAGECLRVYNVFACI